MTNSYFARLCWNSEGWRYPTGEAQQLEGVSFAAENGFGYEEWLFNEGSRFESYQYAFLQPLNRSRKYEGELLDIILWSINSEGERVYVGRISRCEVLTPSQIERASRYLSRSGFIQQMQYDVQRLPRATKGISFDQPFNIRFRSQDAMLWDQPYEVASDASIISNVKRYLMTPNLSGSLRTESVSQRRRGSSELPNSSSYSSPGSKPSTVRRLEKEMQQELMRLLQKRYGRNNVLCEENYVDLSVRTTKATALIEIKTDKNAKDAIRRGLGQILEYAYFDPATLASEKQQLFIVSTGSPSKPCMRYLDLLRRRFSLKLTYCSFTLGDDLPTELTGLS